MTVSTPWEVVGPVQAGEDSRDLYRQSHLYVFRIRTADDALTAPSWPTMGRAGTLLRRHAHALPDRGPMTRTAPLSATR